VKPVFKKKKRSRAVVVILDQQKILLIYRYRAGREYWVLPDGGIKKNETAEQAAIREIKEETNFDIVLDKKLWEFENHGNPEYYFLALNFSGTLEFKGPEIKKMSSENVYRLTWVPLAKLNQYNLLPKELIPKILTEFAN